MEVSPTLDIHPEAAARWNERAEALLLQLAPDPDKDSRAGDNFPHLPVKASLTEADILDFEMSIVGPAGELIGRYFAAEGHRMGLAKESYEEFRKLCEAIQRAKGVRPFISARTVEKTVFKWMRDRYDGRSRAPMIEHCCLKWLEIIRRIEVWIPIGNTAIQSEFSLGHVRLRSFTGDFFTFKPTGTENDARRAEVMERDRSKLQGRAAATMEVLAEPQRAFEIAAEEAERAASVLRYYSRAMFIPDAPVVFVPVGVEDAGDCGHFVRREGEIVNRTISARPEATEHWLISTEALAKFREAGLDTLSALIRRDKLSEFQGAYLASLQRYTRAATTSNVADRLMYIFSSLESLLLRDENEPLQANVADRMAFLTEETPTKRLEIVKRYRAAYGLRSRYVHHGNTIEDTKTLREFCFDVWRFYLLLMGRLNQFATMRDLFDYVDKLKYS